MYNICILGDDKRSKYLRKMYVKNGKNVVSYKEADLIVTPIPFSRDGIKLNGENIYVDDFIDEISGKVLLSGAFLESIEKKLCNIKYYDLMKEESVAILNAIPTAEGAIYEAIKNSDITICNSNCLVMGCGRIGKILSKMLNGIGANVYCEARNPKDLAFIQAMGYNKVDINNLDNVLSNMNYIFNTIPVLLLDEDKLKLLNKDTLIIDLASNPGGIDFEKARDLELNVVWALSLPSKVAPKTAALYLKEAIDEIIKKEFKD